MLRYKFLCRQIVEFSDLFMGPSCHMRGAPVKQTFFYKNMIVFFRKCFATFNLFSLFIYNSSGFKLTETVSVMRSQADRAHRHHTIYSTTAVRSDGLRL